MTTDPQGSTTPDQEEVQKLTGVPLIFMFQPCEFQIVKPDKIQEWEEMMQKNVGLDKFADFRAERTHGFETISLCHPGGACDCDWHDEDFPTAVGTA
jgi:hypothetical protein